MQFKRSQKLVSYLAVISELSHVFCCVLPSLFTMATFLVSMGMITVMPLWLDSIHHMMHGYEIPLMTVSAVLLIIGWIIHFISQKIDCHDTGCGHGPCTPKKKKSSKMLKVATFLFLVNVTVYFSFHAPTDIGHGSEHVDSPHHAH